MGFSVASDCSIGVNTPNVRQLLERMESDLRAGRAFAVATLNLDHLVKLRGDPAFRQAYARQSYVVADGHPIVWLSRLSGCAVELAPGSELIEPMAALAARLHAPVALLGSTEETLERAARILEARHPGLRVVARVSPSFGFDVEGAEADDCLERIAASGARLCFLALGAPKQERLAARGLDRAAGCGFVSIGAGLDFIAGAQLRAPAALRALAMEWLWRMLTNPRRLARRYLACAALLPRLFAEVLLDRLGAVAPPPGPPVSAPRR